MASTDTNLINIIFKLIQHDRSIKRRKWGGGVISWDQIRFSWLPARWPSHPQTTTKQQQHHHHHHHHDHDVTPQTNRQRMSGQPLRHGPAADLHTIRSRSPRSAYCSLTHKATHRHTDTQTRYAQRRQQRGGGGPTRKSSNLGSFGRGRFYIYVKRNVFIFIRLLTWYQLWTHESKREECMGSGWPFGPVAWPQVWPTARLHHSSAFV